MKAYADIDCEKQSALTKEAHYFMGKISKVDLNRCNQMKAGKIGQGEAQVTQ